MPKRLAAPLLIALVAAAGPAPAQELVIGLGRDDIRDLQSPAPGGFVELRAAPFARAPCGTLGFGVAIEADTDRDLWAGGGLVAALPLSTGFRLVPSVMVGFYREGEGNDLGQDFPVFRLNVELDVALAPGWRAGLALGHKSNAYTGRSNPGVESLYLTINRSF
jgi:hypothetical protein